MNYVRFVDTVTPGCVESAINEIRRLADRGAFTLGEPVKRFEEEFAAYCGARFGIGVNSGTDACHLALLACGIEPGDEVIAPANTFIATIESIHAAGARPVPVDVLDDTRNLDPAKVAAAVTSKTKAIVPVHLYGQPADMDAIMAIAKAHGLRVVEDACQAHGALYKGRRVGAVGHAGAFSFYPSKNLGAWGDGGMVVTDDPEIAHRVRRLRNHGEEEKYRHAVPGFCSRLDAVQAAVLRVKLPYLDGWNDARRRLAARYGALLAGSSVIKPPVVRDSDHVWHLYVVRARDRDGLRAHLTAKGIETGIHYPAPVHLQPAFRALGYKKGAFPTAERLAGRIISLPMHPGLSENQVEYICEAVNDYSGASIKEAV